MNSDTLFELANGLALITWIVLILFQRASWLKSAILGISITLLATVYTFLIITTFDAGSFESFGSLSGVMSLFQNGEAVLAGWIHYLAFDLLAGLYIVSSAEKLGINRWVITPSLLLTFMMGPLGLLTYLIIRLILEKKYFTY